MQEAVCIRLLSTCRVCGITQKLLYYFHLFNAKETAEYVDELPKLVLGLEKSISVYQQVFCCPMIEFQPGVPWKGIQSSGDPESDPYMTPGSVLGSPGPQSLNDSDHQLLRDNIGIRMTDKCFWMSTFVGFYLKACRIALVSSSCSSQDSFYRITLYCFLGPNPSLNTSLPSPGAWPYSASDSPLSNAHSTGMF